MIENTPNIHFESIASPHIRRAFLQAYRPFKKLYTHQLFVRRLPVSTTTMRAQPIINSHFWYQEKRQYRIDVSNHVELERHIPIQELPEEVLVGWFAHELGHVMDYQYRGALDILRFGIGYLLLPTFRIEAERQADLYAIEHGFAPELLATKKYLLEHASLPDHYKKRLERFYMSPDEMVQLIKKKESDALE